MPQSLFQLGRTGRVLLRAPNEKDLGPILVLWTDLEVTAHIGGPRDPGTILDHFREVATDPEGFALRESERWWTIQTTATGEFIGLCALLDKDVEGQQETELSYFLLPAHWGKGYAPEAAHLAASYAFEQLGRASIVSIIDPRNHASLSVAHKLGMRFDRPVHRSDGTSRLLYRLAAVSLYRQGDWA